MRRYFLSVFAFFLLPACALAQTGFPPFASIDRNRFDARNNQNMNVNFSLPIVSSPGRGMNLNVAIVYNSINWIPIAGGWSSLTPGNFGWLYGSPTGGITYQVSHGQSLCLRSPDGNLYVYHTNYSNYKYIDAFGTQHVLGLSWHEDLSDCDGSDIISGTFTNHLTDGSGLYASIPSGSPDAPSVTDKSGVVITNSTVTDTNGNYISSSTPVPGETDWTDSAGRVALKIITGASSIQYNFLDPTGAYQTTTLNLQTLSLKTNFACSGVTEFTGTASLPVSLVLPNNQTYQFAYEPTPGFAGYYTGRLQRITLPTGGYQEYDYVGANDGINCSDGTTLSMNRVVSDGTNTATWNFVRNTANLTTTIITPQLADTPNANLSLITFNSSGQEISRKIFNDSAATTVLRTINTTWATNGTPATRVTILEDGSTQTEVDTTFDSNGILDSISEYDWGSGARGSLLRTTTLTYQTSSNYTSRNMLELLTSKVVQDGAGAVQYRQDVTYDGVAITSANCEAGALQHSDTGYPCTFNDRGNPTAITTYLTPATPANGITKNFTYDWFGNLVTAQLNCCQSKTWSYSSATQYSQPDSVTSGTSPTQLTTSATYNAYTGQAATLTDENNLVTNFSYDTLRRPTRVWQTIGSTNGASTSYSYDDTHFTATSTTTIDSSKSIQQITALDSLGRPITSTTEDGGNSVISIVSAQYDLLGRAYKTSNPYTGSPSNWTTTALDVLGRPTSVTLPDNSAITYTYATKTGTVTDPTGKQRKSQSDGVGRLSIIFEPDPTNGNQLNLQTSYTYTVLDTLATVTQGPSQTRTYVYDALGRILSATTPEAGRVCFGSVIGSTCNADGYDSFDNLQKRTDARGVLTSYGYDGLNRLTSIGYNVGTSGVPATPGVSFTYGTNAAQFNNGRLITMTDGVGSESYTYNNLGQMPQLQKVINGTTYTTSYTFNLASELTQTTYPSNRVVQQSVDAIGRLCEIAPSTTGCGTATSPYATGYTYNVGSQATGFKYGNGIFAAFGYSSDRLQLNCLDYSTTNRNGTCAHDSTTKFGLTYSYGTSGSNNGLIGGITDSVDTGRNATYTYDALYRLTNASTPGSTNYPAWGLSETYDRYGNRSAQSISSGCTGITCPTNSVTPDTATNRISGSPYSYDANGNMTNDGSNTLVYDGENHAVSATNGGSSGAYTYDGNGLRVIKVSGSTTTVYIFSGSKVIAEYDNGAAPSAPSREYIYSGGALLAKIDSSGTKYYHQDHLSKRLVTDSNGNTVAQMGHFPYGESWYNTSGDKLIFTSYERDSESGNDYAVARFYVNRLARFSSTDPVGGSTANPQSLNRYTYALNAPTGLVDPTGMVPDCTQLKNFQTPTSYEVAGGYSDGEEAYGSSANAPPPPNCGWGGGGGGSCWVIIDGGEAPCSLAGSGEANVICPNNDCSILNQLFTGQNGQQYSIVPGVDGLTWTDANGNELDPSTSSDCLEPADPCLGSLDGLNALSPSAAPQSLLTQLRDTILNNPKCFGLFSRNPGIAKDILAKYNGVVDISGPPGPNIDAGEKGARDLMATSDPQPVVVTLAPIRRMSDGFKLWTGGPFTTYAGPQFYKDYGTPLQQMTVLIHELLHVANPNMPLTATETKEHNDNIRKNCKTK